MKIYLKLILLVLTVWCISACTNEDLLSINNETSKRINLKETKASHAFPNLSRIKIDPAVISTMNSAWNKMKQNASSNGRREYGFYIYYDEANDRLYCGKLQEGPNISGCANTNATLNLQPDDPATFNLKVCAAFHCHTTLTYCPSSTSRVTGPSQADIDWANTRNIPGLIYDYSTSKITGGHNINSSYKLYTFGVNQRPNIIY